MKMADPDIPDSVLPFYRWPVRLNRMLVANQITTWEALARCKPSDLSRIGIRNKNFDLLWNQMHDRGLCFDMPPLWERFPIKPGEGMAEILSLPNWRDLIHDDSGVYFVRCGDFVKIGISDDTKKRIRELRNSVPGDLDVLLVLKCPVTQVRSRERVFHSQFAALRVRGEWFRYQSPLREFIESHARTA